MSLAGIKIADYDPAWPRMAAESITGLETALPGTFSAMEHIGSTAVPGLAAKPVIDLMVAVEDLDAVEQREDVLVTLASWPSRNQRILRDHLCGHPADAARYAELKHAIVAGGACPGDYASAKTELIQELTDQARRELGLPLVPVWEK